MNKQIKKLATYDDIDVSVEGPFSVAEMLIRDAEYKTLSSEVFKKKYISYINKPAKITIAGKTHEVQMNFCAQPFCKLYGLEQKRYELLKYKPSRYKVVSTGDDHCNYVWNDIPDATIPGVLSAGAQERCLIGQFVMK